MNDKKNKNVLISDLDESIYKVILCDTFYVNGYNLHFSKHKELIESFNQLKPRYCIANVGRGYAKHGDFRHVEELMEAKKGLDEPENTRIYLTTMSQRIIKAAKSFRRKEPVEHVYKIGFGPSVYSPTLKLENFELIDGIIKDANMRKLRSFESGNFDLSDYLDHLK